MGRLQKLIAPRRPMRNTLAHRPFFGQHRFIEAAGILVKMRSSVGDMRIMQEFQELRRIAEILRSFVHARRSVSVAEVCEWASRFLDPLGVGEDARIRPLISLLCEAGDLGFGSVREEQVLIALPERRVELPDGRVIGVGD